MPSHVFRALTLRRGAFAAISTLAAVALLLTAAQSALAVTPLDGEALSGSGPSTGGSASGSCGFDFWGGSAHFTVSGTASGPYPGSFSETGSVSVSKDDPQAPFSRVSVDASFKITSGTTTITGRLTATRSSGLSSPVCDSVGKGFWADASVPYTATIDGQRSQGTASFGGTFYARAGAQDSVSGSMLATHGQITGTVTDSRTGAPLAGICVHAYNSTGGGLASTQTDSSGTYTLSGAPAGSVKVGFSTGCGAGSYVTQYYVAKPSLASADPVSVTAGTTTSGISAAMVGQAQIKGTVTARATRAVLAGICVRAHNSSGVAASTETSAHGSYTISALPTGTYRVAFVDCSHHGYIKQYYKDKATLASAGPIRLPTATTASGISAALVK